MRASFVGLVVAGLGALVLVACHHENRQDKLAEQTATPQAAVQSAVDDLKSNDIDRLLQHMLPPAEYARMHAQWDSTRDRMVDNLSRADRERMHHQVEKLTRPGAKEALFKQLKPFLDHWDSKYKARVPMLVGVLRTLAGTRLTRSKKLSPKQKTQARGVLDALAAWARKTDWGDKDKARRAIGIAVETLRAIKLKSPGDLHELGYDQAVARYDNVLHGMRKLLAVYGLSVDEVLDSARVKTVRKNHDQATVEVDYTVLDKPMSQRIVMVRKDRRWYPRGFLKYWRRQRAGLAHAASATSVAHAASIAPAASRPAAATTTATASH